MAKRIKALVLAAVLVLTLVAAPGVSFNSYAVDATSSASTWAPAPAPTPAPVKPAPTAPVATPTKPAVTAPTTVVTAPGATIPTITRVLHFGSTGADVVLLQKYLTTAGHAVTADGMFGNLTLNAVKAFQAKAGLTADGIFGP
ncbi:MAG TPA: peptidoglycan-binding domain-containing protein, partial [Fusibacter sp.]|nr:peptidoglycan-binding domain-containing protein [Fusibacter sp.]